MHNKCKELYGNLAYGVGDDFEQEIVHKMASNMLIKRTMIYRLSIYFITSDPQLIERNGYETRQISSLYVFVQFLALTVHKTQ